MICRHPFWLKQADGLKFFVSCKACIPCQINRRSEWTGRILLEMQSHDYSAFCTLTYDDLNLPMDRKISKRAVQLFLMRLRKGYYPRKIRYFATGEYGSQTKRAHYHLILFGLPPEEHQLVSDAWNQGFTSISPVNQQRAAYVAKYTTKRSGEHASFGMMSRAPGIGRNMAPAIAKALVSKNQHHGEIPTLIRIGQKKYILGTYMSEKVTEDLGSLGHTPELLSGKIANDLVVDWTCRYGDPLLIEREVSGRKAENIIKTNKMRETL